ncbi:DUF7302 family protein [Curtobacterium sp. USHLN213]
MPEFTHEVTGVAVSVSDETATRLGSEWKPKEQPKRSPGRPKKSEE